MRVLHVLTYVVCAYALAIKLRMCTQWVGGFALKFDTSIDRFGFSIWGTLVFHFFDVLWVCVKI
jgi:hypothetical protein